MPVGHSDIKHGGFAWREAITGALTNAIVTPIINLIWTALLLHTIYWLPLVVGASAGLIITTLFAQQFYQSLANKIAELDHPVTRDDQVSSFRRLMRGLFIAFLVGATLGFILHQLLTGLW